MRTLLFSLALGLAACASSPPPVAKPPPPAVAPVVVTSTPLTTAALTAFMQQRFAASVKSGMLELAYGSTNVDVQVIEEGGIMGISTVEQLAAIIPADYETKGIPTNPKGQNIAGLVRDLLVIKNAELYFTTAWRNGYETGGPRAGRAEAYGVDLHALEARGLMGGDGSGGDVEE